MQENTEDRKNKGRNKIKYKRLDKNMYHDFDNRDRSKIKKQMKSKIEQMREEELWEDWENEIS